MLMLILLFFYVYLGTVRDTHPPDLTFRLTQP